MSESKRVSSGSRSRRGGSWNFNTTGRRSQPQRHPSSRDNWQPVNDLERINERESAPGSDWRRRLPDGRPNARRTESLPGHNNKRGGTIPVVGEVDLSPEALSTTATMFRDDPIIVDFIGEDSAKDLKLNQFRSEFSTDFSAFIVLLRSTYNVIKQWDMQFTEDVSFGMFQYYCVIALWHRIYGLRAQKGIGTVEFGALSAVLGSYKIPQDVSQYMIGVGHIFDQTGVPYTWKLLSDLLPSFEGCFAGSFGRVTSETAIRYETLPSPVISALKISADFSFSEGGRRDWDLPAVLQPLEAHGTPNENLLGWAPASALTESQKGASMRSGMASPLSRPDRVVGNIPLWLHMFDYVKERISRCEAALGVDPPQCWNGSIAQTAFISRDLNDMNIDGKNIAGKSGSSTIWHQVPLMAASVAQLMKYRIKRRPDNSTTCDSLCYNFKEDSIPQAWIDNENSCFMTGSTTTWNDFASLSLSPMRGLCLFDSFSQRCRRTITRR